MLKDNPSTHESHHFDVVENLFDTIFEKMNEAIDMSKGLLKDSEDVIIKRNLSFYRVEQSKEQLIEVKLSMRM